MRSRRSRGRARDNHRRRSRAPSGRRAPTRPRRSKSRPREQRRTGKSSKIPPSGLHRLHFFDSLLLSGTKIGRYVVKKKLAEGGMAEIYLGTAVGPEGFEKEVVLKVVRSFLARDEAFMKMFVDEARLASRLNHANVVQIFDFAKHDDSHFIAMEYVRGVSLWDLRRRCRELGRGVPVTVAAEIGLQVARGLHYAHSLTDRGKPLGLVHRDVTPHNVLLSFDGAVKLTDFGIAKASGNQTSTAAGMLKGKFAYMSPEQARGEKVDARTDVFALGIVLWELVTGGRLFEGESDVAVLRAVQSSYISPPLRLNPEVPTVLDWVIMKALERDETKRFQSALELERALANFVLHHATSLEDTNVGLYVSRLFKDKLEERSSDRHAAVEGTESTAKDPMTEGGDALASTAIVERDHTPSGPSAEPTAQMPGVRRRGPLEDEDDDSRQPTDQMKEYGEQTRQTATPVMPSAPVVVLRPSFAKEVEEAARVVLSEDEQVKARTTQSLKASTTPIEPTASGPVAPAPSPSRLVWGAAALAVVGFAASVAYLSLQPRLAEPPFAVEPPPPARAAAPPEALQRPSAEPPPTPPELAVAPVVDARPAPRPAAPAPLGTLELDVKPFAAVTLNGKPWQEELIGIKRFNLKAGHYVLEFKHPRRTMTKTVDISANQVTQVPFRALETR
ncbi:MAG: serine/threonine protein kinase [Myxococcaceae bacterium]|nr:serine/threonine protein kinase [Myxococcaceae bacterium]